jgi:hypothetical protein
MKALDTQMNGVLGLLETN